MTPEEIAKNEAQKEWERRMVNFTTAMVELVYWDRKPLEQALAYNITMQRENSRLRERIAELESHLTQHAADMAVWCANCANSKQEHWHRDTGEGVYEFADCGSDGCACKKFVPTG